MNPNDPTASTYLPFGPPVPLIAHFRSGEELSSEAATDSAGGWSWPAALVPTLWAARHRSWGFAVASGILTLLFVGLALARAAMREASDSGGTLTGFLIICALVFILPRSMFAGIQGSRIAWRSGIYANRETLSRTQRRWTVWAIIGVGGLALLLGYAAILLGSR